METVTLAGGCFWCTEAIFKRLKGVEEVTSGYSAEAESVQIKFDPKIISFEQILEVFWHLVDPTTLNKQGNDVGEQYRSVIFYHSPKQKKIAEESKNKTAISGMYKNTIVTKIEPFKAEDYHQNYYEKNEYQPYCQLIINPKIDKLIREFNDLVKT